MARVDFAYPSLRLIVEVSGRKGHMTSDEQTANAARHRRIVADGSRYIEFTSEEVFRRPAIVLQDLRAALQPLPPLLRSLS